MPDLWTILLWACAPVAVAVLIVQALALILGWFHPDRTAGGRSEKGETRRPPVRITRSYPSRWSPEPRFAVSSHALIQVSGRRIFPMLPSFCQMRPWVRWLPKGSSRRQNGMFAVCLDWNVTI